MALSDLSPQLRTRLSRQERAVGYFVILAVALLLCGLIYYIYQTVEHKGWLKRQARFFTFTERASGLKVGDPVMLMGFGVGTITMIDSLEPEDPHNVYVEFILLEPYEGYMWTKGSGTRVATVDLLGKRQLEVTKGTGGYAIYILNPLRILPVREARNLPNWETWRLAEEIYDAAGTNLLAAAMTPLATGLPIAQAAGREEIRVLNPSIKRKKFTAVWNDQVGHYEPFTSTNRPYWLVADESPALSERVEKLLTEVETALPKVLSLTNQLTAVLNHGVELTSNANAVALSTRPAISNLTILLSQLDQPGALGEWLLPTNIHEQLETTLASIQTTLATAQNTMSSTDTNLTSLTESLGRSLENLAEITGNLNQQVQKNTNIVSEVSQAIQHADDLVQGLKRHWFLRSAFRTPATNQPAGSSNRLRSPKDASK